MAASSPCGAARTKSLPRLPPGTRGHALRRRAHHRRLHRRARALPAAADHRRRRQGAARLARRATRSRPSERYADRRTTRAGRAPLPAGEPAQRHHHGRGVLHRASRVGGACSSRRPLRGTCGSIAGKVLMDRNAPAALLDTAQRGYDESKALIGRWHGKGRLRVRRDAALRGHVDACAARRCRRAEARASPTSRAVARVGEPGRGRARARACIPHAASYLDVYARHGLTGPRTIYGHGVHLDEADFAFLHETAPRSRIARRRTISSAAGCSGCGRRRGPERPVRVGLATDLGGGTSFSMLRTMQAAYEVAQLAGGAAVAVVRAVPRHPRRGAGARPRHRIGSAGAGHGSRRRRARPRIRHPLLAFRMAHAQRHRRSAGDPDGARRRPRGARHVRGGAAARYDRDAPSRRRTKRRYGRQS